MKVAFRSSFLRDVKNVRDAAMKRRITDAIVQVEAAQRPEQIVGLSSIAGEPGAGRMRVGDYRHGLFIAGEVVTFVRCLHLHRREIYRYFL